MGDGLIVRRGGSGSGGAGEYVWKRKELLSNGGKISVTQLTSGSNPTTLQLTSNDIDLSLIDESFFVGLTGGYSTYTYEFHKNNAFVIGGGSTICSYHYDPKTHILSLGRTYSAIYTWTDIEFGVAYGNTRFVISNSENAYPEGVGKDGCLYESYTEPEAQYELLSVSSISAGSSRTVYSTFESVTAVYGGGYSSNYVASVYGTVGKVSKSTDYIRDLTVTIDGNAITFKPTTHQTPEMQIVVI